MTDGFKDRERGFENKWAHDAEMRFKVMARRNKLLGLWAAGEMGIGGDRANEYAMTVVQADFQKPGDEDVFDKVKADFAAAKLSHADRAIRSKMDELLSVAGEQVMGEAK
ncbi:MAG TPA: DUF1476 domain-containing protein [Rhizomicrobium sp.]|nr:DUF1476 domain-containing protein [Rhizomicrobium sp.]